MHHILLVVPPNEIVRCAQTPPVETWKHAWTRNGPQQVAWMHETRKCHEKLTRNLWREAQHHTHKRLR